jgi:chloramphenicol-sensitive protein RarD
MTEPMKGVLAMLTACTVWGLSALYYKMLAHVPPLEVLSHRTLWSLIFFSGVLVVQGRLRLMPELLRGGGLWPVGLAALMISANWFMFIYSVQAGHTVEASLGYYIFPLVAVLIGMVAFKERLRPLQTVAVLLALLAVIVLTIGLGVTPWIALALAGTFGFYGMIKKRISAGPVVSVSAEVLVLAPIAILCLGVFHSGTGDFAGQEAGWFGRDALTSGLLAFSGPLTAVPLMLFSYASRRVTMATLGLVQYINPTLQFLCATLFFAEPFTLWHQIAFALIWIALALFSWHSFQADRAMRRGKAQANAALKLAASVGTSGTTLK